LRAYLADLLAGSLATFDLPLLYRAQAAARSQNGPKLLEISQLALAGRETRELWRAEVEMGRALTRLIEALGTPEFWAGAELGLVAAYALLATLVAPNVAARELGLAYAYSFLENQLAAASRLIPLGQTAARRILLSLGPELAQAAQAAESLRDEEIGSPLFGLAIYGSRHESQAARLFRS
jgi:urease accessory protein